MTLALHIENLALARGERVLFRDLSFSATPSSCTVLTGPNGAGKTSLLRALAGFLRPHAGTLRWIGDPDDPSAHIHWVAHQDGLRSSRTAGEELRFWSRWFGGSNASADAALAAFDLSPARDLEVRRLSAGQRRRLALARLLAAPRPVWLLDEPLAPLDAGWRARFGEIMARHLSEGGLILAAVHDPLPVAAEEIRLGEPA